MPNQTWRIRRYKELVWRLHNAALHAVEARGGSGSREDDLRVFYEKRDLA